MLPEGAYPATGPARDRFVIERRGGRPPHDPWRYQGLIIDDELGPNGRIERVAAVLLTGRECPWRCVMCDLWKHTVSFDTPVGSIPRQIRQAREEIARRREDVTQLKLYNAGSFLDPRAVPERDYRAIAEELVSLDRVIVESHPALIGPRLDRWLAALAEGSGAGARRIQLEVAMGLETAHPRALERLHKGMTLDTFREAADALRQAGVALRVFLLIQPPFVEPQLQDAWLLESVAVSFASGATAVSLVPTRPGNGALEALAACGDFRAPRLGDIERSVTLTLDQPGMRGRLFVDIWDLGRFSDCPYCLEPRRARLHAMNLSQTVLPDIRCAHCSARKPA
jgi:radical SAM enzyme (TIGR01210 family)